MTLHVGCFKWHKPGYRSTFGPETVNVLRSMVARNLSLDHEFFCVTDDAAGIDPRVRVIPLWNDFAEIPNPSSPRNPSCYRRLKLFSAEAATLIGERIVCMDLDTVIVGDVTPLFDRPDDFVIWGGQTVEARPNSRVYSWYNGSLLMLRAGTRRQVWESFDPRTSPARAHRANCRGSDQGWISFILGAGEKVYSTADGVYSYRNHVLPRSGRLPSDARFVSFHGQWDPWMSQVKRAHSWVREHYR